jgi:predicted O-methyltransferase YrrM
LLRVSCRVDIASYYSGASVSQFSPSQLAVSRLILPRRMAQFEDDPFAAFGGDNDDDDSDSGDQPQKLMGQSQQPEAAVATTPAHQQQQDRDPTCGVLTFHTGTEQALVNYVQHQMASTKALSSADRSSAAKQVLHYVDQFCYTRHWMMHVGDEKGKILKDFVREFCRKNQSRLEEVPPGDQQQSRRLTIVELGTYCGYSSILMALTILESMIVAPASSKESTTQTTPFKILSVDVNHRHQAVAQKLVRLAQLEQYFSFVLLPTIASTSNNSDDDHRLVEVLRNHMIQSPPTTTATPKIDFLFIDHDKDLYVPDLKQLEQSGWIQQGTHVAADNVIFFDIPYRQYIRQRVQEGVVSSNLVMGRLEYVIPREEGGANLQDGMELSVYLKDPSFLG